MSLVEDQEICGRSRNRILKKYSNLFETGSGSSHNENRESGRVRKAPATIQTVLYKYKSTDLIDRNTLVQEIVNDSSNDLNGDRFTQSKSLSSALRLSPDLHQHDIIEKHNVSPRVKQKDRHQKSLPIFGQGSSLDHGSEKSVDINRRTKFSLEMLHGELEDSNGEEIFFKYVNTDNSFRNLQSDEITTIKNVPSELSYVSDNRTNITTPSSTIASAVNKLYNRMSKFFNGDPNNIYSLSGDSSCDTLKAKEQVNEMKNIKENNLDAKMNLRSVQYESEQDEDNDPEEEYESEDINYKRDAKANTKKWTNSNSNSNKTFDDHPDVAYKNNYKEDFQEINDFQSNFVQKFNTSMYQPTGDLGPKNRSRTLQKILDYKDLHSEEFSPSPIPTGNFSSKWQSHVPGNTYCDYGIKIQHEAIMSEYTQIKLRFSSTISGASSGTYSIPVESCQTQLQMKSKTGVLGFIDRSRYFRKQYSVLKVHDIEESEGRPMNDEEDHQPMKINFDNKDKYLSKVWQDEVSNMFPVPDTVSFPKMNSCSPDLEPLRKMSIDLQSEDCDIYQNGNENRYVGTKSIDLSQMARSVRLKRYAS